MLALVGLLFGINVAKKIVSEHYGIYAKGQQLLGQDGHDYQHHGHDHFRDDFNLTEEQDRQLCDGLKSLSDRNKTKFISHLNSKINSTPGAKPSPKSNSVVADVLNKASSGGQ